MHFICVSQRFYSNSYRGIRLEALLIFLPQLNHVHLDSGGTHRRVVVNQIQGHHLQVVRRVSTGMAPRVWPLLLLWIPLRDVLSLGVHGIRRLIIVSFLRVLQISIGIHLLVVEQDIVKQTKVLHVLLVGGGTLQQILVNHLQPRRAQVVNTGMGRHV